MKQTKELIVGTYARYSSDNQRETSVEDQQRLCQEVAEKHGYTIADVHVYSDKALSGTAKHNTKRLDYQKLMKALRNKEIDVLIADEISRLSRDVVELANLQQLIENTNLILLTADGFTSETGGWQLNFGLKGMVSQQSSRETSHRIKRGLEGSLDRGYMTTRPPYGYLPKKDMDERGNSRGTHWLIDKHEAEIVNGIFEDRKNGKTLTSIAKKLNSRNIPKPHKSRKGEEYWSGSNISAILKNKIYSGVYIYHGSYSYKKKASQTGKIMKAVEYPRPQLSIISDQVWKEVNAKTHSGTNYGGGKHKYSGLIKCSVCFCYMSVAKGGGIHCSSCYQARSVGKERKELGRISSSGVEKVLIDTINYLDTPSIREELKKRLEERLSADPGREIKILQNERKCIKNSCEHLAKVLAEVREDDKFILNEYTKTHQSFREINVKISELKLKMTRVDPSTLEKQISVDLGKLTSKLFNQNLGTEKIRALLCRVFDEVILIDRLAKNIAILRVTVAAGVVAAVATDTEVVDQEPFILTFKMTSRSRPKSLDVELISSS